MSLSPKATPATYQTTPVSPEQSTSLLLAATVVSSTLPGHLIIEQRNSIVAASDNSSPLTSGT
ncbi:1263_t:CDS:2 [Ambispora gerdemannii]|uniref:1263_t:CDS:1 n=1 Tax=Ambispora gerdemannii TaxID=144530 RepID=A0A9N9FXI8_9GLOM|nr:1263_t:CDS:2 [Ambispora gerdemannii]